MSIDAPQEQNEPAQSSEPPTVSSQQEASRRERQIRIEEKVIALDRTIGHLTSTARVGLTFVTTIISVMALLVGVFLNIQVYQLTAFMKYDDSSRELQTLMQTLKDDLEERGATEPLNVPSQVNP